LSPPTRKDIRLVISASSLGTVFEWYDFYIYGTLAGLFGRLFFPADSATAGFLLALATFGVGFAVRPLGAVLFGFLGDRFGRKHTFIITITLMGIATAAIGVLPTFATIGVAAPILLVTLRALQGLAVGGEYGGASIYVAEHAPNDRRGFYTSFIQTGAPGGLVLALSVSLGTITIVGEEAWAVWGWRIPFLCSLLLLAFSLWMRMKLAESPVFQALKASGATARNPLRESLDSWPKVRLILTAMIGIAAGQAVVSYTGLFDAMYFLQNTLHVHPTLAKLIIIVEAGVGVGFTILFGWASDKVGRKKTMMLGYVLAILLFVPLFRFVAEQANPALTDAMRRAPVVVRGSDCTYNPFASKQATACGRVLDLLSRKGVAYSKEEGPPGTALVVAIGGVRVDASDPAALSDSLERAGYSLTVVKPSGARLALITLALIVVYMFGTLTYGPLAAWMVELFPARVRYTSMSIPYHVGIGYAGGFLPFISQYSVAKTGDPFAGFGYAVAVATLALFVAAFFLPETNGKQLD
jgi:MFS family permease